MCFAQLWKDLKNELFHFNWLVPTRLTSHYFRSSNCCSSRIKVLGCQDFFAKIRNHCFYIFPWKFNGVVSDREACRLNVYQNLQKISNVRVFIFLGQKWRGRWIDCIAYAVQLLSWLFLSFACSMSRSLR